MEIQPVVQTINCFAEVEKFITASKYDLVEEKYKTENTIL